MSRHVPRMHLSVGGERTLCRVPPQLFTEERAAVTCRMCLKRLAEVDAEVERQRDKRGAPPAGLVGPTPLSSNERRIVDSSIAGEPLDDRPPYGSARALFDAIALTRDVPRSIASSSRFEPRGTGTGATPTTPREMHDRKTDLDKCWDCGGRPMQIGGVSVPADVVAAILTLRLLGKQVRVPVVEKVLGKDVDRRSHTMQRRPAEAEDIAVAAGLTRHQVGMVVRHGRAAIINEAVRKGLLPRPRHENTSERESEDEMAKVIGYDLAGWKEIASLLEKSEDWCQRYAGREVDPLPVKRREREILAVKSDVLAWYAKQVRAA